MNKKGQKRKKERSLSDASWDGQGVSLHSTSPAAGNVEKEERREEDTVLGKARTEKGTPVKELNKGGEKTQKAKTVQVSL